MTGIPSSLVLLPLPPSSLRGVNVGVVAQGSKGTISFAGRAKRLMFLRSIASVVAPVSRGVPGDPGCAPLWVRQGLSLDGGDTAQTVRGSGVVVSGCQ